MHPWKQALREGLLSGSLASILSTAALAIAGRRQTGHAAAPTNAVSHWLWGDEALHEDPPSWRYTANGYAVHHIASLFWATLHARAWSGEPRERPPGKVVASAVAASAVACFVDFKLTPHRLTPGFQHRLSRPAMAAVYGCFALGLALGTGIAAQRRRARLSSPGDRPGLPGRQPPRRQAS